MGAWDRVQVSDGTLASCFERTSLTTPLRSPFPPLSAQQAKGTPGARGHQRRLHRRWRARAQLAAALAGRRLVNHRRQPAAARVLTVSTAPNTHGYIPLLCSSSDRCETCTADRVGCAKVGLGCRCVVCARTPAARSGQLKACLLLAAALPASRTWRLHVGSPPGPPPPAATCLALLALYSNAGAAVAPPPPLV